MRLDNVSFENINTSLSKEPYYVIEISFDTASTDLMYATSNVDAALPGGALSIDGVVKGLTSTSQKVTPEKALSTIGAVDFQLVDINEEVTTTQYNKLQLGDGLRGKRVRVYVGYKGLVWADYVLVQTQIVEDVSYLDKTYFFKCDDVQRQVRKDVFDLAQTTLTATAAVGDVTINVTNTSGFESLEHGPSYSDAPSTTVHYFKIDDEIIRATGKDAVSFTGCTRGALNTKEVEHKVDVSASQERRTEVKEYVYLELPAPKLMYALLTGVLIGDVGTLPTNWHLGIDTSLVRLTDFTEYGIDTYDTTTDNAGAIVRFEGLEKQDGKRFLETEVLLLMGAFSPVYSTGELGLRRMASVLSSSGFVYLLDEDNVVSHSALTYDMSNIHNHIEIEWNWSELKEKYTRNNVLYDAGSIAVNGESNPLYFKFRGLHGSRHSAETLGERFNSFRDRYTGPPIRLSVRCLLTANMLEVGDVVRVKLDGLQDYATNTTLDRSFEIQRVSVDWVTGQVNLQLFASSQAAGPVSSTAAASVIGDAWYTSEGIDLATFVGAGYDFNTDYENIGGVGHIKLSSSILGGTNLTLASITEGDTNSVFYHDGDLVIDTGVTLDITKNIQLRVKGHLTINGDIQGIGTGHTGAVDRSDLNQEDPDTRGGALTTDNTFVYNAGTKGFLGPTVSGGGERYDNAVDEGFIKATPGNIANGFHTSAPNLTLDYADSVVKGIPTDLQGTAGSSGGNVGLKYGFAWRHGWHQVMGGAGGNSGAGLFIVSRGASFGASGFINTSGTAGAIGSYQPPKKTTTHTVSGSNSWGSWSSSSYTNLYPHYAGGGAGGAPGAVYFAIDGDGQTFPDLTSIIANYGCTRTGGTNRVSAPALRFQDLSFPWTQFNFACLSCPPVWYPHYLGVGCDNATLSGYDGGSRVVFVIGAEAAEEDADANILPAPTLMVLTSGTDELLLNTDGTVTPRIKATWTADTDSRINGYHVQYKKALTTVWLNSVDVVGEVETFISPVEAGIVYEVRVRSVDGVGNTSDWLYSANHDALGKTNPPNNVTGFSAYQNGSALVIKWTANADVDLNGYEIRYLESTGSNLWVDGELLNSVTKGTNITTVDIPDGTWLIMIKAIDTTGNYSTNYDSSTLVFSSDFDVISSVSFAPAFVGTLTNMVYHHTGKLVPDSQDAASIDTWDTFDITVPNPFADCYYEVAEYDQGFDDTTRISSVITSALVPIDPVGSATPHLDIDYRLAADAYDGFERWTPGNANFRYLKARVHVETAVGVAIISEFTRIIDALEWTQKAEGVTVDIAGTVVTYPLPFHLKPYLDILVISTTSVNAVVSPKTETQFTVRLFDATGTAVAGTIDWKAIGV